MRKLVFVLMLMGFTVGASAQLEIQTNHLLLPFNINIDVYSDAFMLKNTTGFKQELGVNLRVAQLALLRDNRKIYRLHVAFGTHEGFSNMGKYLDKHNYIESKNVAMYRNTSYYNDFYSIGYSKLSQYKTKTLGKKKGYSLSQFFGYGINIANIDLDSENFYVVKQNKADLFRLERTFKYIAELGFLGTTQLRSFSKWINMSAEFNFACFIQTPQVYSITHRQIKSGAPPATTDNFVAMPKLRFEFGISLNTIFTIVQKKQFKGESKVVTEE